MILLKIIFETLILYQIAQIISESTLFSPIRRFFLRSNWIPINWIGRLLDCFLCTSVWVGFVLSFVLFNFSEYLGYYSFSWFWNGLYFSSMAWFLRILESK